MADVVSTQEEKDEHAKVAEVNSKPASSSSASSSDEDEKPRPRKKAATKRRTYRPPPENATIPSCGIYSTLSTDRGLEELKFHNLPAGFSLDDEDDEDDDFGIVSERRKKVLPRQKMKATSSNNNSASDLLVVSESSHTGSKSKFDELRSPSPPPPPSNVDTIVGRKRQRTPKKTSTILRNVDAVMQKYKTTSILQRLDDSVSSLNDSISSTPSSSSNVIDLDSPSFSPSKRSRKQMTVKIRTRGGMQKFIMQMPPDHIVPAKEAGNKVKIRTGGGIQKFIMPMDEMFSKVMETLARLEGVDKSWIKLMKSDDDISEFDTPSAVRLRITDILECVIVDPSSVPVEENESLLDITPSLEDCVQIKIQGQDRSSKQNFTLQKDRPLRKIMAKYSQSCGVELDKLKFYFDGDVINPSDTPEDLDMDEENAVDVVISQ